MRKKRTISELVAKLVALRDSHGFKKIHNPKDLALALVVEASDILAHYQWKNAKEINAYLKDNKSELGEQIATVVNYILLMSHDYGFDIEAIIDEKMQQDSMKYPTKREKNTQIEI